MLSVLTVSRNPENVNTLLNCLRTAITIMPFEILCSWNGETSDESKIVHADLAFRLIPNSPYHFSKNNNYLASLADGEWLLFINDDVLPDPKSIDKALSKIIKYKSVGIVGGNLRYPSGMLQHAGVFFDDLGNSYHRLKHQICWDDPIIRTDMFVPAVTGAFLLVHREEFLKLHFDETFQVAGEDIVFCLRYRQQFGKEILYSADATMIHKENDTRKTNNTRKTPTHDMNLIQDWANKPHHGLKLSQVWHPKVRIVTEPQGWIMYRMAEEIKNYIPDFVRINQDWDSADVHYYINYGKYNKRPNKGLVVANFTHFDPDNFGDKFIAVANQVDHCVSISVQTTEALLKFGIPEDKITTIIVGADNCFQPKLTLGVVGRIYPGGRKGEDIIHQIISDEDIMKHVQIVSNQDGWGLPVWQFEERANFYRSIDYLLVTSRLEGGPVPFMEALACGVLSIAPPIGVIPQFPHVPYKVGDVDQLKEVILRLAREHIRQSEFLTRFMRGRDWQGWASQHIKLFHELRFKKN